MGVDRGLASAELVETQPVQEPSAPALENAFVEEAAASLRAGDVSRLYALRRDLARGASASGNASQGDGPAGTAADVSAGESLTSGGEEQSPAEGGRTDADAHALVQLSADAPADEAVLTRLAADELPIVHELRQLESRLAIRIGAVLDDPALALAVARVMQQVTTLSGAVTQRVQNTLGAAANLRAQRRLISRSRGGR